MLKKIFGSLLLFTSIVFNSYSVQVVRISTLSDLALKPKVIKYMQHNGRGSIRFEPRNNTNELEVAKVLAMNELSAEELSIFDERDICDSNRIKIKTAVAKWAETVIKFKYHDQCLPDKKATCNEVLELAFNEIDKIDENFNNVRIVRINTLSDLVLITDIVKYIKNNGRDSVLFKPANRFANNAPLAKVKAMSVLTKEDISIFESKETYKSNIKETNRVIFKWAKEIASLYNEEVDEGKRLISCLPNSELRKKTTNSLVNIIVLDEIQKFEENFRKIQK